MGTVRMKSKLIVIQGVNYLLFFPKGYDSPIYLPVITKGSRDKQERPTWTWNGSIDKPTIKPSIRTEHGVTKKITHYWLNDGICKYLGDCTDGNANTEIELRDIPNKYWGSNWFGDYPEGEIKERSIK